MYDNSWFKELNKVIDFKNKKVLDFGGSWGNLIISSCGEIKPENYTCLDVDQQALKEGKEKFPTAEWIHYNRKSTVYNFRGGADPKKATIKNAISDKKYDIIFAYSVFTHMTYDEFLLTINELKEQLADGGKIFVSMCLQQDTELLNWYNKARVIQGYRDINYRLNDSYIYVLDNIQVDIVESNQKHKHFLVFYDKTFIEKHGIIHDCDVFQSILEIDPNKNQKQKVFITGHTSGIGKALYDMLSIRPEYEVKGGSRSTDWDVSDISNYQQILDYDVLINNAYHRTGQLDLLRFVYNAWQGKPKTIINVGSAHNKHQIGRPHARLDYNVTKAALEQYSNWIYENDSVCRSMMYNPGFVDTPLARTGMNDWPLADQEKVLARAMNPYSCARTIQFMIENNYSFREVTHG